jgi:hypothetical protein
MVKGATENLAQQLIADVFAFQVQSLENGQLFAKSPDNDLMHFLTTDQAIKLIFQHSIRQCFSNTCFTGFNNVSDFFRLDIPVLF